MGLKEKLARLKKATEGRVDYIELVDGSRFFYEPEAVWSEIFKHGSNCLTADYRSEARPEAPEILQAVAKAKDRRVALEKLFAPGPSAFMGYDLEVLISCGEFAPRSFLAGHTYEESLEYFAEKNAEK